ncbi:LysR substrate-binding domain-containing protein [Erythrobacter sp. MTPC3]|uniref:LysR substrate-binding domain-containing protein n=1 Tax=Erythrobacter sp. MTPC3 TaxID=3056564 RepID=UPI0036F19771
MKRQKRGNIHIPDLALRTTAGAWKRLNRDLGESTLDMIMVHDPVFRRGISAEPIFNDKLILVGACEPAEWRERYVRIEWGEALGAEIGTRLSLVPQEGLILDLGLRSALWLVQKRMAGFLPEKAVAKFLAEGALTRIDDTPTFDFPAYACWRSDMDEELAGQVIGSLKSHFDSKYPN